MNLKELLLYIKDNSVLNKRSVIHRNLLAKTEINLIYTEQNEIHIILRDIEDNTNITSDTISNIFDTTNNININEFNKLNEVYLYYLDIVTDIINGDI